jgi:hypothetical protein
MRTVKRVWQITVLLIVIAITGVAMYDHIKMSDAEKHQVWKKVELLKQ